MAGVSATARADFPYGGRMSDDGYRFAPGSPMPDDLTGKRVWMYAAMPDRARLSPASWPRFHHDNANPGDARRDAASPGRPEDAALSGAVLRFTSPGDDGVCGRAARYEVRTSSAPITPASFAAAKPVAFTGAPVEGGGTAALTLTGKPGRHVAVRAVDEPGNVGRPAAL